MKEEQQLEVLYGMVQKSLKELEATRAQLAQQSKANAKSVAAIEAMAPQLEKAVSHATAGTMRIGFETLSQGLARRMMDAGQETAEALEASSRAARQVIAELNSTQAGIQRDWWQVVLIWSLIGGFSALAISLSVTWWLRAEIDVLGQRKLFLAEQIAQMEETAKRWEGEGSKAELTTCKKEGARPRLCVRVDEKAGRFGGQGDGKEYRVIWGY